ncbi:hypothetical protein, conserved [Babesia ovata]|uniref:Extracellular matrix-binding ebh n=1 Tax=Babesia ovata TaxID=189622 RepID=A0A2H6K827_9APIC|nr:uncharacterized protein BOVATA_006460 [Babesia ovata]GBE59153.1 hypothetical protein, conserved [Babesia ovata]
MAPKKLTDCPENLRESIDWLIQVKHGGDEKGLEHLAKALQKLIGEAIKKANTSLSTERNNLNCLGHHSFDNSPKSHCQSLDDQIAEAKNSLIPENSKIPNHNDALNAQIKTCEAKKRECEKYHSLSESDRTAQLKDIEERQHKLAELSGQLGEFIGNTESVREATNNAIIAVINKNPELKNEYASFVSQSSESVKWSVDIDGLKKEIQLVKQQIRELESQIEGYERRQESVPGHLSKFHESLTSKLASLEKASQLSRLSLQNPENDNPAIKLLESLCTGLQTFLGFDPNSKGYDGTGIVYSDLDRLCDGAMAFLHGVLKDVHTKQPYKVGKEKLFTEVVSVLEKKLCSGHKGFQGVITEVADGVGRYNDAVQRSNNELKSKIQELLTYVRDKKGLSKSLDDIKLKHITDTQVQAAKALAEECEKKVKDFKNAFNNKITENRVSKYVPKQEYTDLNSDLRDKIDNARKNISQEATRLKTLSDKERRDLEEMLAKINETLNALKNSIIKKINEDVGELVTSLKNLVNNIKVKLDGINKSLVGYVQSLKKWIEEADEHLDGSMKKVKEIEKKNLAWDKQDKIKDAGEKLTAWSEWLEKYIPQLNSAVSGINAKVKELGRQFPELLEPNKNIKGVFEHIKQQVIGIQAEVGTETGGPGSIHENWQSLKGTINGLVGQIVGDEKPTRDGSQNDKGLKQIVAGIIAYAKGFREDAFKTTVQEWVKDIVTAKETIVSNRIGSYVTVNKGRGTLTDNDFSLRVKNVEEAINKNLPERINTEIMLAANAIGLQGAGVGDIGRKFQDFAARIEMELPKEGNSSIGVAVQAIGEQLGITQAKSLTPASADPQLKAIIKPILKSIVNNFKQVAKELERFVQNSQIANMMQIITNVEQISKQLNGVKDNDVPEDYGKNIDDVLGRVQLKIQTLHSHLSTATGQPGPGSSGTVENHADEVDKAIENAKIQAELLKSDKATELIQWSTDVTSNLEALKMAMAEAAQKINQQLTELKEKKIGKTTGDRKDQNNTLQKVHDDIYELLTGELTTVTLWAKDFVEKHAEAYRKTCVGTLTQHVNDQVKIATDTLTTQARKQYVTSVKDLVTAFGSRVETELSPLLEEFDTDLKKGFKGLMNKIGTIFIEKIKENKQILTYDSAFELPRDSRLRRAVTCLYAGFENFIHALCEQNDVNFEKAAIDKVSESLKTLLQQISDAQHFGHLTTSNLTDFKNTLGVLYPGNVNNSPTNVFTTLKHGFAKFIDELKKQYVNVYDGAKINWGDEQNPDKEKCAKVCLTLLPSLYGDLTKLKKECGLNPKNKICLVSGLNTPNSVGNFLQHCGYEVAGKETSKEGELRCHDNMNGEMIVKRLQEIKHSSNIVSPHLKACESNGTDVKTQKKSKDFDVFDILQCIRHHFNKFFELGHLLKSSSKKHPCSVYEMCIWLAGLHYNSAYKALLGEVIGKLDDQVKQKTETQGDIDITLVNRQSLYLNAYPTNITYDDIEKAINDICSKSYKLLTCVAGTGDAECIYACDYYNNSMKFYYPSSGEDCLDTLLDILRRLFPPLKFLYSQCRYPASIHGWSQCHYGKHIATAKWPCRDHSIDKPNDQSNTKPICQPTSPLHSYLNDCLTGFLPHGLEAIGCKAECTTCSPSSRHLPCLTPLGFKRFSGGTKTGEDLFNMLEVFFDYTILPYLFCLIPKPPSTLAEHFNFAICLVRGLVDANLKKSNNIKQAIESSIKDVSISLCKTPDNLTDALSNAYGVNQTSHAADNHTASYADLSGLSMTACRVDSSDMHCAPYLSSLSCDTYTFFAMKHSKSYLSWALYIPWNLHRYLENLLKAFTDISCADWGCPTCLHGDKCKKGEHGKSATSCQCPSIITFYVHPALPLVAVAPVPAAHPPRPPRRPEDTLPPEITLIAPHRRTVPPRRRTRQGTSEAKILLTVITSPTA